MPVEQVQAAVETFLAANWSTTVVVFENVSYQPPSDPATGLLIPWVYCEVQGGLYEQHTIGAGSARSNLWLDEGQLWFHVVTASGIGSLPGKTIAAALAELFRGLTLPVNIDFGDIQIAGSGGSVDGDDWSISVSINWTQG